MGFFAPAVLAAGLFLVPADGKAESGEMTVYAVGDLVKVTGENFEGYAATAKFDVSKGLLVLSGTNGHCAILNSWRDGVRTAICGDRILYWPKTKKLIFLRPNARLQAD